MKRGSGKINCSFKNYHFYKNYCKRTPIKNRLDRKTYNKFIKDLLETFSQAIINENLELKLEGLGKIRIRERSSYYYLEDGTLSNSIKVDWKSTWEYWEKKYPGLTRDEILLEKDKKVLHFENKISSQYYGFYWDKYTIQLVNKQCYAFKITKQNSIALNKSIIDPNRKIYYYG